MADQPPIFISYGRDDETADFVPRLHDDLEASGFKAWLDTHDIKPGEDWDLSIQAGLDSCRALVLVVTRKSLNSSVVKAEWNRVLSAGKPVVPLMWGKDVTFEDLPFRLQLRQGIDFKEAYSQAKAKLFQFLRDLPANPTPVELSRARLEELKKAQAASDTPERFEQDIQEVQKRIAYEEDRAQNPDAVEQREQASLKASLERIQQQQSREAEARQQRRFSRVVGHAPQNVQAKFKDRTAERASLRSWFADTHTPLMVVVGHGGMGKTALTCYVMDELEGDSEKVAGLIYLSTVMGGVNLEKVFLSVGQMTGQQQAMTDAYNDAKTPLAGRIQKLLDVLEREDGKRYILLLDNFETLQNTDDGALTDTELHEFLTLMMQQTHPLKILITTRIPLKIPAQVRTRVKTLPLEAGLPTDEAVQFLQDLGVTGDKNKLHELAARLHGYPRALEAAAAYLSDDPHRTLDDLLAREDIFHIEMDDKKLIDNMVRAALTGLAPEAQRVMQALAVYDRPVPEAAVEYLLDPFQPVTLTRDQLRRLTRIHLVTYDSERYSLHPVDHTFAYNSIPPSQENPYSRTTLATRAADYFKTTRLPQEKWKSIQDVEPQLAEFEMRFKAGDYDTAARIMGSIDFDYLMLWGHSRRVMELREPLIGKLSDRDLESVNYGNLGLVYQNLGRVREAIPLYEKALELARQDKNRWNEGAWLGGLGIAYSDLGEVRTAITYYEQALAIAREIGDRRNEGAWVGNLGIAYYSLGEVRTAITYYEQALAISREIGDRSGEGADLGSLGNAYRALGEVRKAIEYHEKRLIIYREIGAKHGEGVTLSNLGDCYRLAGNLPQAIQCYRDGLALAVEVESPTGISYRAGGLAASLLVMNDLPESYKIINRALEANVPENNHNVFALKGIICLRQGESGEAADAFRRAAALAEEMIAKTAEHYEAWYAKGLALAGLAVIPPHPPAPSPSSGRGGAEAAYREARRIFAGAGVIRDQLMLLDELRKWAGVENRLDGVRRVLAGEA